MSNKKYLRYLPAAIGVAVVLVVAVVAYVFRDLFEKPVNAKKQIQQITVVQPPPPPPPEEKPPPPPEVKEEKIEEPKQEPEPEPEPEQQAEEPPPGEDLGVDADGSAGSDAFGLVGKKGGRGLIGGSGGGGNALIYFGQQLTKLIEEELQRKLDQKVREKHVTVTASLWVGPDGNLTRAELVSSSGTPEVDSALKLAFSGMHVTTKAPPASMPQPIKVRVRL